MALKKVLLAYDGSPDSQRAAEVLLNFAKLVPVEIVIINVLDSVFENDADCWAKIQDTIEIYRQKIEDALMSVAHTFSEQGLIVKTVIKEGHLAFQIIDYAVKGEMDVIVCGTRGRGGFEALVLGSVAHQLVTHAPMPVLVIKANVP